MTTLLLRLAGPTQGWDTHRRNVPGRDEDRWPGHRGLTDQGIPTKTGVVGLLAAALGRERGTDMSDLLTCTVLVRTDQPGRQRREYRTTRRRTEQGKVLVRPQVEVVLDDGAFLVGVGGGPALLRQCAAALTRPHWPLYLGKREFPPAGPILLGLVEDDVHDAVADHPWIAADWFQRGHQPWLNVIERVEGDRDDATLPMKLGDETDYFDWFAEVARPTR